MKKNISVDIQPIEQFWGVTLHEFEPDKTYPLSKLMDAILFPSQKKKTSTEKRGQREDME